MIHKNVCDLYIRTKGNFDKLTGSKVVERITKKMDACGVLHILEIFENILIEQSLSQAEQE